MKNVVPNVLGRIAGAVAIMDVACSASAPFAHTAGTAGGNFYPNVF
ncbi:MAG: hypothetical protein LBB18_04195 [Puniceicoccales bacterium]|nr:hypothetical protein [Puniceicoccales bacterium]